MMKPRYQASSDSVVVEVRGGVVVGVYSDAPNLSVRILDWDEIDNGDMSQVPVDGYLASNLTAMPPDTSARLSHKVENAP